MFGYLLLGFASIADGISQFLNKKLSLTNQSPSTITATISLVSTVYSIPLLLYNFQIDYSPWTWLIIGCSVAAYGLSLYFGYLAYQTIDASIVVILHKLNIVFSAILGIILISETYTINRYIGLALVFFSSLIIIYDKSTLKITKGIVFAVLMAFTSALAGVLDKRILSNFSPFTYVFINNFLIWILFSIKKAPFKETIRLITTHPLLVTVTSLLSVGSWTLFLYVLSSHQVSQVMPIFKSMALIIPVILGITILHENDKLSQKILGTLLGVIGIILIAK